ncbi:MAG TPA: hypothetical protein VFN35_05740, partial [Ktedonobacteraceae bacterium]|nr:hypothetical protein [Ktedonobacteraceae bacterium]
YITHFMGSYTGEVGFAVILLLFFYYFAVILLLGAEINAYTAEKVKPLANNVAAVLYDASQPIEIYERQKQASADKKVQETRPDNKEAVDKLECNEPEMTNDGKLEAPDIAEIK